MAEFEYKVTGFAEIYKRLDHLPDLAKRKGLEPLVVKSLEPMRDTARALAPDDPETGPPYDLKSSIEVSTKQKDARPFERISSARAFMGSTKFGYPQAVFQEFGTIKMVATPHMRPAWDNDKDKALKIISEGFAAQVEATLRKYGAR